MFGSEMIFFRYNFSSNIVSPDTLFTPGTNIPKDTNYQIKDIVFFKVKTEIQCFLFAQLRTYFIFSAAGAWP